MILVTGFQPFLGEAINPSTLLLRELRGLPHVETLLLPVEYDGSFHNLKVHLQQKFQFLLMLGQAGGAANIRLERVALNLEDAAISDEGKTLRQGHLIEVSGPAAQFSDLPLNQWCQKIQSQQPEIGHRIEVSNHAGTYVCNSLYYKVLRHFGPNSLFVHLPFLPEQTKAKAPGTPNLELEDQKKLVLNLLELISMKRAGSD